VLGQIIPRPFETKYTWSSRMRRFNRPQLDRSFRHLQDRGLIKIINKNNQKFVQLTKTGQIEILLRKAQISKQSKWDRKWRIIMYDIPEDSKDKRHLLRFLLKKNGFKKLQASAYISPYALNRDAIVYLTETGLTEYIRILRVDEMDDDRKLKKLFNLA
jgi:phenylacetic acid degradation operon negative regulatory protein